MLVCIMHIIAILNTRSA